MSFVFFFFFSSRRRHTRLTCDWSSDVCSSDLSNGRYWGRRQFMDLVAWKAAFAAIESGETNRHQMFFTTNKLDFDTRAEAAPAVLEGLKSSETDLAELRAASQRPYARYPVIYDLEN